MNDTPVSPTQSEAASPDIKLAFVCDCEERARSACQGQPFFKELEGKRYCVLHYPDTDKLEAFRLALKRKLDAQDFDFQEVWFPESVSFEKFEFSALANFGGSKFSALANFYGSKFSADANFSNAMFSAGADFSSAMFSAGVGFLDSQFNGVANFSGSQFSGVAYFYGSQFSADANFSFSTFGAAANFIRSRFSAFTNFIGSKFSADANFESATFSADANFSSAMFSAKVGFNTVTFGTNAYFRGLTFSADTGFNSTIFSADADFSGSMFRALANFSFSMFSANADFSRSVFSADASFSFSTFKNYVSFAGSNEKKAFGKQTRIDFQHAHIEKPERVSFHTVNLRPYWFINTDCRKFEFVDCFMSYNLKKDVLGAMGAGINWPYRLLAITYRQLADNAEANHRYHEASRFRFSGFEVRRIERFRGIVPWQLDWWYWLASGYGESVRRALFVFLTLLALFAFTYGWVGFDQSGRAMTASVSQIKSQPDTAGKPLNWKDAYLYSVGVSILQKPDPKPLTRTAKFLVYLQTILGPAQAALLALAVRRKFMR
ncbi:MAG: pentapeptide repeat-containing protein [Acidobacteria bacterium]|nr:pentapeptide repeat-containing protein [Acidobacteriota bacterium]